MTQGTTCLLSGTLYFPYPISCKTRLLVTYLLPEHKQKIGFWLQTVWTLMCDPVRRQTPSLEAMRMLFRFINLGLLSWLDLIAFPLVRALRKKHFQLVTPKPAQLPMARMDSAQPLLTEAPLWWFKPSFHCPAIPLLVNGGLRPQDTDHARVVAFPCLSEREKSKHKTTAAG